MKKHLAALAFFAFLAIPSLAQTDTGSSGVTMQAGTPTVTFTSGLTFGNITLTGEAITNRASTANLVLEVNDNSGDGKGWTLGASATDFSNTALAGTGMVNTIPASNMTLNGTAATFSSTNTGYTAPATKADLTSLSSVAQTFVTAGAGEGVGLQTVTVPSSSVLLDIPYNAISGSYTSTVTFTLTDV